MGLIAEIHKDLDRSALQLMAEYHGRLRVEAVRLCADDAEAEDLVFRTLERVVAKADTYKDDLNLFAWMKSIMESIHKNDRRRPVVRGTTAVESDKLEEYAGADWSTDEEILRNSDCEVLREVLQRIDPKERDILLMRYYDGFSLKEIANVLNMPVSTVGRRIHLAMRLLAGKLGTKLGKAKKPLAVLGAILLSAGTLFGAYQVGLVDAIKAAVAGVEKVEKSEPSASLSAPVSQGGAAVPAAQKEKAISNEAIAKSGRDGVPSPSAFPSARLEAETNDVPAVESISANEQEGTNEMKEVQVVKALAGAASAVTLAAAPLLAAAEEEPKPYDAVVDYVQSTGTQCVDTGVKLGPTHTVVLKFARVDGSAIGQNVFGYSPSCSGSDFKAFIVELAGFGEGEQGLKILRNDVAAERLRLNFGKPTTVDHELRVGPDGYYLDGISMPPCVGAMLSGTCAGNAHIFGVGVGWNPGYVCGVVRVKACQIYDGATLVRDFRPVRKDGAGRLYDCVSKTLYATKGTGALAKGPDSAEQEFGELKFTKNVTVMNRRLKYIESTGVQAVTVDAKEGATTETTIRFSCSTPLTTTGVKNFYGYSASGSGTDDRGFAIARELVDGQERFYLYRRETSTDRKEIRTPLTAFDSKDHVLVLSNGVYKLDGVAYGPMPNFTRDCSYSGCLFATYANFKIHAELKWIDQGLYRNGTRDIAGCPARLYSFTMKRDGKVVRRLVPMQTAIGVGLWDTVANRFHPCISYSGDFIAGPPAPGLALILF